MYFTTTAPASAGPALASSLEAEHGCTIVGVSHRLADRAGLASDLEAAPSYDVLLTELKAAAIDVAAERALDAGAEVVFCDNRPETVEGDGEIGELLVSAAQMAADRAADRKGA